MKLHRILTLAIAVLLVLTSCDSSQDKQVFRYDLTDSISNLDPQYAQEDSSKMVLYYLYEGLVRQTPDGEIVPAAAEKWELSEDETTYIFHLREHLHWADNGKEQEEPVAVNAEDFVFGIRRIFNSSNPYYQDYLAISGSRSLMGISSSELDQAQSHSQDNTTPTTVTDTNSTSFGVTALNDTTLQISLDYPDPMFLEKLSRPAAMPCNEEFFQQSMGRYGLDQEMILGNGAFYLQTWDNEQYYLLRRNEQYQGLTPISAYGVNFYPNRTNILEEFEKNRCDVLFLENEDVLPPAGQLFGYQEVTWGFSVNFKDSIWGTAVLRQGLAKSIDRSELSSFSEDIAYGLFPSQIKLYSESLQNDKSSWTQYNRNDAKSFYQKGLDALELFSVSNVNILVPDSFAESDILATIQQQWKDNLGLNSTLVSLPMDLLKSRVEEGNYQIAFIPLTSTSAQPDVFLEQAVDTLQYESPILMDSIAQITQQTTLSAMKNNVYQAESLLLSDGVFLPVLYDNKDYVIADDVSNVEVYPFQRGVNFNRAVRK